MLELDNRIDQDKLIKFYVGEKRMFSFFSSFVMIVFEKHREMND